MRHHGWELPYHPLQVVAIAVFISLAFAFYVFFIPFLGSKVLEYHVIAIFSPLVLLVFALYIRCAAANPADPGIEKCKVYGKAGSNKGGSLESITSVSGSKGRRNKGTSSAGGNADEQQLQELEKPGPGFCAPAGFLALGVRKVLGFLCPCCVSRANSSRSRAQDELLYCSLCEAEIFKFSKHCRACDKCVDGFDHHCRWINNCIGRKNYKTFVSLMVSGLLLLVMEWSVGTYVIVRCLLNRREFQDNIISKLGSSFSLVPFIIVVGLCSVLALLATFPLGQLFFFHLILIHKGISTYDYIVAMRERDQMQGEMQSLQSSPVSSVATAMSGMSSHGALQIHSRRPWCTPPRLLVEQQDTLVKDPSGDIEQGKEIIPAPSSNSKKDEAPKKASKKAPVKISAWKLARLNAEDASKAADRARENSSVLKPLANEPSVITETDSSGEIFNRSPAAEIVPFPARKTKRKRDISPAIGKEKPPLFKPHRDKKLPGSSSEITSGKHSRKKSIGSDDSVAPLQLEARSAFGGSTTPGSSSAIAPSTSLLSPDESYPVLQQQQVHQAAHGNGSSSPGQFASRPWLQRSVSDGYEASGGESADDSEHGRRLAHAWNRLKQSSTFMNSSRGAMPPAPWVNVNKLRLSSTNSSNIEANILKHVSLSRISGGGGGGGGGVGGLREHSSEESNSSASQYNSPDRDSDFFSAGDSSNRRVAASTAAGAEMKHHQSVSRSGSLKAEDQ